MCVCVCASVCAFMMTENRTSSGFTSQMTVWPLFMWLNVTGSLLPGPAPLLKAPPTWPCVLPGPAPSITAPPIWPCSLPFPGYSPFLAPPPLATLYITMYQLQLPLWPTCSTSHQCFMANLRKYRAQTTTTPPSRHYSAWFPCKTLLCVYVLPSLSVTFTVSLLFFPSLT